MSMDITNSNDQILSYAQGGDSASLNALVKRHRSLVEAIASKYSSSPIERDDLIQEGMIGLFAAIKSYDSSKGASLNTYASICINNAIQNAINRQSRTKDIPVQNVVEYDEELHSTINTVSSAEDIYIAHESVSLLTEALEQNLSDFENEVLRLHITGCSYNEIAKRLGKSPKAIDNALQRVRRKISNIKL